MFWYKMQELNVYKLSKNFKSTGAKDHPYFWIEGASDFIPNMLECIAFTDYSPTIKKYSEFENDHEDELKELFIKHGSDKFINPLTVQAPPLPNMPQPVVQTAKAVNPNTNLTRTQEALLSPEEKVIARG